jgi:pimeloyl-ACP methyl ester carboxylesterase
MSAATVGLSADVLPPGIRSRFIDRVNGLRMHVLEAGTAGKPLILMLHGFPELAYSWRKVMLPLAAAGFHVVAPDQRGYGATTGWSAAYDQDIRPFSMLNLARDALSLVHALGHTTVAAVIGHDFGSPVAGWCALLRPDVFRSVVLMSAPFPGAPSLATAVNAAADGMTEALAALPRPRKHYHAHYSTRVANEHMWHAPQGVHAFLRAYFHHKSADWPGNHGATGPHRLDAWSAEQLAKLPTYYVMELADTMPESVAPFMPSAAEIAGNRWMSEMEMGVYSDAYGRTGFQGGLNWYRTRFDAALNGELTLFGGRQIEVPAMFIAGKSDWGVFQVPGTFERMQDVLCARMTGCHLLDGAGHWVMQEQPERVSDLLLGFCGGSRALDPV